MFLEIIARNTSVSKLWSGSKERGGVFTGFVKEWFFLSFAFSLLSVKSMFLLRIHTKICNGMLMKTLNTHILMISGENHKNVGVKIKRMSLHVIMAVIIIINRSIMDASTEEEYRKIAVRFYKDLNTITPASVGLKLAVLADKHGKQYWRKIRRAVAFDQKERGFSKPAQLISKIEYPADAKSTPKARRVKKISLEDMQAFSQSKVVPKHLKAALKIIELTGCRPSEFFNVIKQSGGKFVIYGAKKSKDMKRGADRTIVINDIEKAKLLANASKFLNKWSDKKKDPQAALQQLMNSCSKKLFPRRVARPSFYSFRHQYASNLKGSDLSAKEQSYLMGHQSNVSINNYGSRKSSSGKSIITRAANNEVAQQVVRDKTKPIPSPKPAKEHSPGISKHLKPSGYTP